jgi:hypothetical protein
MNIRRPTIISAVLILAMVCLSLAAAVVLPGTVPQDLTPTACPPATAVPLFRWR